MSALAMTRWPLAALLLGLSFAVNASESTTRLRLPPEQPSSAAPGAPAPAPAATPAAAPTSLRLRMPEQAKGAPIAPEPAGAPPSSVTLPDGTIAISAALLTQEMLKDGNAAVAKYRGRPVQFQGVLNYHLMNNIGAFLGMTVTVPMVGYKYFHCISFDRDSREAARALGNGKYAIMAGIFITHDIQDHTQAYYMSQGGGAQLSHASTLHFAECVVLTGHPNPPLARALMAGWANARQLWK